MKHVLSIMLLATGIVGAAIPASAQHYYARERLMAMRVPADKAPDEQTPPDAALPKISCGTRTYQHWAANYNSRPVESVARVGPGVSAEKLCQDYASSKGSPGVCGVSTASADPQNPSSGYMMNFYPGDTQIVKDGPAFASEYSIVCTKQ